MTRIFISHSHSDKAIAKKLVEYLLSALKIEDVNIRCTSVPGYMLPPGTNIEDNLRRDINGDIALIGLLTKHGLRSQWVLFELGAAWGMGKKVIPILGIELKEADLPGPLKNYQPISIEDTNATYSLNEMIKVLANYLTVEQKHASSEQPKRDEFIQELNSREFQLPEPTVRGYWLLSNPKLWNAYMIILEFAKLIHHTFQVLEHEHLNLFLNLINNIASKPKTLDLNILKHFETTWDNYVNRYNDLDKQFLKKCFDAKNQEVINQSWLVVKAEEKKAINLKLSEAEQNYQEIIKNFLLYTEYHKNILSLVGRGQNLSVNLQVPIQRQNIGVGFLDLERQGKNLTGNADNLIKTLIEIFLEE